MKYSVAVFLAILLMAGCTTNIGETQFAQGEIIEIGGLFALTGYGAVIGEDERRAVELAIHERN